MVQKIGREVAEKMLSDIYSDLQINQPPPGDEDEKSSAEKLIDAICFGRLEYDNEVFKQTLISPIEMGKKKIGYIEIKEPTGVQLRSMSQVKKKNDDVGKAMAVLGEVTGLGLIGINKLKSRDLMVSVSVISLFL